jgi:hypothetical protein
VAVPRQKYDDDVTIPGRAANPCNRRIRDSLPTTGSPLGECVDVATLSAVAVVDGAPASVTAKHIAADQ